MPGGAGVRRPDHPTTTRPTAVNGALPGPESPESPEAREALEADGPGGGGPWAGVPERTVPEAGGPERAVPNRTVTEHAVPEAGAPVAGAPEAGGPDHAVPGPTTAPPLPTDGVTAEAVLAPYLQGQAADFLRSLRLHREHSAPSDAGGQGAEAAARALRRSARRISGSLHTFRTVLDPVWADHLRTELAWLSGTLAREHAYAGRLTRLLDALHQLSGATLPAARGTKPATKPGTQPATTTAARTAGAPEAQGRAVLGVGAARAGALLERQLTLARTRAHSAALQALGSSRFHAVADAVALLASEVPLAPGTTGRGTEALLEPAERAEQRLLAAVVALPADESAEPYNEAQDAAWHQARLLLRLHRYAHEVVLGAADPVLTGAGHALDLHRDAAEAAAAAAAAARTPRIAPATAYALGVLHADQRHEVEAARAVFRETWPYATAMTAP
ncbi:CHAD domain-containing protein [Streptomyces cavourensis]|uniref:CHAD domain-containing protein n=1 Tax=Streptomyces cavourensis TaxID=67258 RepID=A0ABY5F0V2_9ACTN|nr:CHAD domain-containing protein [Streptomyces cavourensis]UTR77256.1 CHAD domain-containing protein [Streptomyces cavourensis]